MNTVREDAARYRMWCRLIDDYGSLTKNQKKHAKERYTMPKGIHPFQIVPSEIDYHVISTDCASSFATISRAYEQAKEKGNNMAYDYDNDANLETQKRNHLKRRADSVYSAAKHAIAKKYTPEVKEPKTKNEIARKLTAGEFTLSDSFFTQSGDLRDWMSATAAITWTDPSKPQDEAGAKAAWKVLEKAFTDTKDAIIVKSLDDGLKALQDFEAMSF